MMIGYPVWGKAKSAELCRAFVEGAGGGQVMTDNKLRGHITAAVFWGVDSSNERAWLDVKAAGIDYYYGDNSYFDEHRGTHFRFTKNALQHSGAGVSTCERFDAMGIDIKPWRESGEHLVLCEQSSHFMHMIIGYNGDWLTDTLAKLQTERPIRIRHWNPDKKKLANTLGQDLAGAHALVTWSSAAAITAILAGVPAIAMGKCAATCMAGALDDVEHPPMCNARNQWAGVLADNEWTIDELKRGMAWEHFNEQHANA